MSAFASTFCTSSSSSSASSSLTSASASFPSTRTVFFGIHASSASVEGSPRASSAELSMEPTTTVDLADERAARQTLKFVEALEDLDDVQNVYANFDIPAQLMERLEASIA